MVKTYSLQNIYYDISGRKFVLPIDKDVKEDEIIEKVISLFSGVNFYERELFAASSTEKSISIDKYGNIVINCLYEGMEEYYKFELEFEVFQLKYNTKERIYYKNQEIEDGQWMVSMTSVSEYGPLLDELIEKKSLPLFLEKLNLNPFVT
jgi:S-adenosylmethionine hydrolase